jgi:hypothetical protein
MKMAPLTRQYHPSIVDTNLDIYKVKDRVTPFNMDAREFVKFCVEQSN